jgi:signal peptide peptidase-like 3
MIELFGSRVSTCVISILLIVYGSFRSLNMEQEAREKEKKRQSESSNNLLTGEPSVPIDPSKFFLFSSFSTAYIFLLSSFT